MKVYRLKGCLVTQYEYDKFWEGVDLDIFKREEDAKKAKEFYENFKRDTGYSEECWEDIKIVKEYIYENFDEFKKDMMEEI